MKIFRPGDVDLDASVGPAHGFASAPGRDAPATRSAASIESADGGLRSGVWESGPGTAVYRFSVDEWAYILDGEATVTVAGATHVLRAGDVFYTPAGEEMTWEVAAHVRKVWVHRRPPIIGRIRRKLGRMAGRSR